MCLFGVNRNVQSRCSKGGFILEAGEVGEEEEEKNKKGKHGALYVEKTNIKQIEIKHLQCDRFEYKKSRNVI